MIRISDMTLLQGTKDQAIRLFPLAASDCPDKYMDCANSELKTLDASP